MNTFSKTFLVVFLALSFMLLNAAYAVEWDLNGELAVELTDSEADDDLDLDVTTTDLVLTITESFGNVDVEGFINYELREDADGNADGLTNDGAGITVSGDFGSVFVGDDGSGAWVGTETDVLYNNSEDFFLDPTTNVIDYGFPFGDAFSLNVFVEITNEDNEEENIDAAGAYGSLNLNSFTFALGYTAIEEEGAYGSGTDEDLDDDILDLFVGYSVGAISTGAAYQATEVTDEDREVTSFFLTYTTGPVAITPYYQELDFGGNDDEIIALNISYSFTDNFYIFFETADYDSENDNSEIGLVLTF